MRGKGHPFEVCDRGTIVGSVAVVVIDGLFDLDGGEHEIMPGGEGSGGVHEGDAKGADGGVERLK